MGVGFRGLGSRVAKIAVSSLLLGFSNVRPQRKHRLSLRETCSLSCNPCNFNPYPRRTYMLRLLGPKTLLYKAFGLN